MCRQRRVRDDIYVEFQRDRRMTRSRLQAEIVGFARENGIRLMGPTQRLRRFVDAICDDVDRRDQGPA